MLDKILTGKVSEAIEALYMQKTEPSSITVQKTRPEFTGDMTVVTFPLTRYSRKSPEDTGKEIGNWLLQFVDVVESVNIIKGFLNLVIRDDFWLEFYNTGHSEPEYGFKPADQEAPVVIEYSSPNTNKPLHLGHIRNNLLGWSIAEILKANGKNVVKVNLVNDRGIHICKTMLAYRKWGNQERPGNRGIKGDKFVGDLYVRFEQANKEEMEKLMKEGLSEDEAYRRSTLTRQALDLLQQWELGDADARQLWETMNNWVYEGFNQTYLRLGVDFDRINYESETYLLGKELVKEGLDKGIFYRKEDGSAWVDLKDFNLDEKLLLRSDGTSVYMTQDLGTAQMRVDEFQPGKILYVVGNEQIYHFDVLKIILKLLGRDWADDIVHVSYGMVELPQGKMKSREGTVVDADELMEEMFETAKKTTSELGKLDNPDDLEWQDLFEMLGMGALKYFILRVDPKKNILFNPAESIDFNGHTGPFIQYTHARIRSLVGKAESRGHRASDFRFEPGFRLLPKEREILKLLYAFPATVEEAGKNLSPALIASYCYELAREYNQFYQEIPVLREPDLNKIRFRLGLSEFTANILRRGMGLLGIQVPEKM